MTIQESGQKHFSRERVRNRMLRRAAEIWGFSESEMDDFDPLVNLLIEACSVEFEKIAGEIGKTQNRMLERLAKLLYPGMIDTNPAHGIIHVRSSESTTVLNTDSQFIFKASANDRKKDQNKTDIFFSPATATKIFDGAIDYISSTRVLWKITDTLQKTQQAVSVKRPASLPHAVWIGLKLNEELETPEDISFFINWANQPESADWYLFLPFTEWLINNLPLQKKSGLAASGYASTAESQTERVFDPMKQIEDHITELYSHNYITICPPKNGLRPEMKRQNYPPVFEQLFDKKSLQEFKEPLLWIEIRFPTTIPPDALDSILISMNSFPVINRKLNKFTYKLAQRLNIVPLETPGIFLSMKEIINSQGQPVRLIPFAPPDNLPSETYTLRYGINRFDERNSFETLVNLTELIREESSYFSSLGEDFLTHHIRELNQVLARIEDKVKMQNRDQAPFPYLAIKPRQEGGMISVEYWSCNGVSANKIAIGAKLFPYQNNHVVSDSVYFLSSTSGGRNKFNDAEKIDQYKRTLMSHNRVVTAADLKMFMNTALGDSAQEIQYKMIYSPGKGPGEGFIRYMQISIIPRSGMLEKADWDQKLREVQLLLEKESANYIPYLLKLADVGN
jgi:hypothetical protein